MTEQDQAAAQADTDAGDQSDAQDQGDQVDQSSQQANDQADQTSTEDAQDTTQDSDQSDQSGQDQAQTEQTSDQEVRFPDLKFPEGMTLDKPIADGFAQVFDDEEMTAGLAQKLVDAYHKAEVARLEQDHIFQKATVNGLKEEWGSEYGTKKAQAERAMAVFGNESANADLAKLLDVRIPGEIGRFGDHPAMLKFFQVIGSAISEGQLVQGKLPAPKPKMETTRGGNPVFDR